jgi:hypothetical protein
LAYVSKLRKGEWIVFRDAPDIRPDNPAFLDILYPAGYQIAQPDIRLMYSRSNDLLIFSSNRERKNLHKN